MKIFFINFLILTVTFVLISLLLIFISQKYKCNQDQVIQHLNEFCLPQIQCKKCGYQNCKSYAHSIIRNGENFDKCLPGGIYTKLKILDFLNFKIIEKNLMSPKNFHIVRIEEKECIGCTRCTQVCPANAIVGTTRSVHTVIHDICIGCDLCINICPVKCIKISEVIAIN